MNQEEPPKQTKANLARDFSIIKNNLSLCRKKAANLESTCINETFEVIRLIDGLVKSGEAKHMDISFDLVDKVITVLEAQRNLIGMYETCDNIMNQYLMHIHDREKYAANLEKQIEKAIQKEIKKKELKEIKNQKKNSEDCSATESFESEEKINQDGLVGNLTKKRTIKNCPKENIQQGIEKEKARVKAQS